MAIKGDVDIIDLRRSEKPAIKSSQLPYYCNPNLILPNDFISRFCVERTEQLDIKEKSFINKNFTSEYISSPMQISWRARRSLQSSKSFQTERRAITEHTNDQRLGKIIIYRDVITQRVFSIFNQFWRYVI